jgi:hypothetical protein
VLAPPKTLDRRRRLRPTAPLLLAELNAANRIDWSTAAIDGSHIDAKMGAGTGPSPVNRGKPGSQQHLIADGNSTPLQILITCANIPDVSQAVDLLSGILVLLRGATDRLNVPRLVPAKRPAPFCRACSRACSARVRDRASRAPYRLCQRRAGRPATSFEPV